MKRWYESKTMWAAIGLVGLAAYRFYTTHNWDESMELVFTALAVVGIRTGTQRVK